MRKVREMNEEQGEWGFQVDYTDTDIKTMYYAVTEALKNWPGAPQRPAEEQETLRALKMGLFTMILEINYEESEKS